jgi:hypothetical protein
MSPDSCPGNTKEESNHLNAGQHERKSLTFKAALRRKDKLGSPLAFLQAKRSSKPSAISPDGLGGDSRNPGDELTVNSRSSRQHLDVTT